MENNDNETKNKKNNESLEIKRKLFYKLVPLAAEIHFLKKFPKKDHNKLPNDYWEKPIEDLYHITVETGHFDSIQV